MAKGVSYDPSIDIKLGIQSHALVDAFMDKVQGHAQACGMEKAVSNVLDNPMLYTKAIETVHKKLAKEELETIAEHLSEQVVRKNISKIASKSTPDQAKQLLAKVREELPNLEKQSLQEAASLEAQPSEEVLANTTPKSDINLLKRAMCSMKLIDQVADHTLLVENTSNRNYTIIVPNDIDHGNPYRKCSSL